MSDLQDLCGVLEAIDGEILAMAKELHGRAQTYSRAASQAASAARSAEGAAAAALVQTANALSAAARHCAQAAMSLNGASREGQAFVQRTVGATSGSHSAPEANGEGETTSTSSVQSTSEIMGWLRDVNPGYSGDPFDPRSNNCGNCARVVSAVLSGRASAPASTGTLTTPEMEAATGCKQVQMSPSEIEQKLISLGPGSHAVVGIDRQGAPGHWFNAYYDGTKVVAIDGQSASIDDWPPSYGTASHPVINWDAGIS